MNDVDDLFVRAMIRLDDDDFAPPDDPTGWTAIGCLHRIATRKVLDNALMYCVDTDPLRRRVGAHVLAQLGHSRPGFEPIFVEERFAGLMNLLETERNTIGDPRVLSAVCIAFGHLHDARAIRALLGLRSHPDADVRYGVAMGLAGYEISEAIDGLIAMSDDPVDYVRDWVTFGLGQLIRVDTPAVRAALQARSDDLCVDVRNEAIEGLARRGDPSAVPILRRELLRGNAASPLLDAAIKLATSDLCEALNAVAAHGLVWEADGQGHNLTEHWEEAMRACGCIGSSVDAD